jgi:hypothetical protein
VWNLSRRLKDFLGRQLIRGSSHQRVAFQASTFYTNHSKGILFQPIRELEFSRSFYKSEAKEWYIEELPDNRYSVSRRNYKKGVKLKVVYNEQNKKGFTKMVNVVFYSWTVAIDILFPFKTCVFVQKSYFRFQCEEAKLGDFLK